MRQVCLVLASTALGLACGGSGRNAAPAGPTATPGATEPPPASSGPVAPRPVSARTLEKDETLTSASGATFTASTGWSVAQTPAWITLTSPEHDVWLTHIEVQGRDYKAAIAAAWTQVRPGFDLKPAQERELPGRDGWDAMGQIVYVTPTAESRIVLALGRRKGETWYVVLLDGKIAGVERRGAQLGTALESLKVQGLDKEDWSGKTANVLDDARLKQLDEFIVSAMATTEVPGAAIAIVQGGRVIYEKGHGVKELGKKGAPGPNTLFMIGSTTKSLTTLMMARGGEAGAYTWETPVTQLLPSFALGDEATTRALRLEHTVCACTGMPRQDYEMLFEYASVTPERRLEEMKTMVPTTGFGETFQYSNLMVSAGGFAAAHAQWPDLKLGPAYDKAMQQLVFGPLRMTSTTFDFKKVAKSDHASSHGQNLRGKYEPIALKNEEMVLAVRPAGAAWSNLRDLERVLLLELGKGKLDGQQVVSEANLMRRRAPMVKITDESSYGLGVFIERDHGVQIMGHGGNVAGFTTDFYWLPEHDVGVVVLTNAGYSNPFQSAVRRRVMELLFDARPEAVDDLARWKQRREQTLAEDWALIKEQPDADWFAGLAGAWTTPGLGRIDLRADKKSGRPVLDAGEWAVTVGQKTDRDGTVKLITTGAPWAGFELVPRDDDGETTLLLDAGQQQYVFKRVK
jgi:CubicO group peptidase (beta-lactamase class C family)